jgi:endogenous inhibitor of DNA gyrase (YacG/DUF329 family)
MIRGRCPICSKRFEIQALADLPTFPFCSDRCRLIDLGRWIGGAYAIPSSELPDAPANDSKAGGDEEEE